MKKLSITLPTNNDPPTLPLSNNNPLARPRRPSVVSLPPITSSLLHRKDEDLASSPSIPYADGPIQIIPGIWLGSEENARDWNGLIERGIKSVLNVAKEVASPFDAATKSLRTVSSTPNFRNSHDQDPTYYPPHIASGRPAMHYLKLQWSHGQQDLVEHGFQEAMQFTDAALQRSEAILIHCQCGVSRSATMVIALVMRAAAENSPSVPPEVWALKGMQEAYAFVKEKSPCVGPNMHLIYQLSAYEKKLKGVSPQNSEPSSAADEEEEEWGRRRRMLDEPSPEGEEHGTLVMQEARALDKAMEDRIIARKASTSSITSTGSGVGMGAVWRSRYGSRKRTGSIASSKTNGSIISEDLVEEEEERELLGIGGGFDDEEARSRRSSGLEDSSVFNSPDDEIEQTIDVLPVAACAQPPSAPVWRNSFHLPPPATAVQTSFDLPPRRLKRRPPPIGVLPPVPSSPITLVVGPEQPPPPLKPAVRQRAESRKLAPPPLHLRNSVLRRASAVIEPSVAPTPSQTLFVFPPSPTLTTRTPSTMTLTSNVSSPVPFPSLATPRVSTFRSHGRTRSFIGLGASPATTVGFSKVDARGYVGLP